VIVVADTSPICYLLLIGEIDLLAALFGTVTVPRAVATELQHASVPAPVAAWMEGPPDWFQVRDIGQPHESEVLAPLDVGEREAILLAQRLGADLVVLDDRAGREAAKTLRLKVTGTLGVLEVGARRDLVDLRTAITKLRATNFRATPVLLRKLLERNR